MAAIRTTETGLVKRGKKSPYTMFMTLQGGLAELIETLERQMESVRILRGHPVERRVPNAGAGYELELEGGERISAKSVILAVTSFVA